MGAPPRLALLLDESTRTLQVWLVHGLGEVEREARCESGTGGAPEAAPLGCGPLKAGSILRREPEAGSRSD
jgi:hypothetical protein